MLEPAVTKSEELVQIEPVRKVHMNACGFYVHDMYCAMLIYTQNMAAVLELSKKKLSTETL